MKWLRRKEALTAYRRRPSFANYLNLKRTEAIAKYSSFGQEKKMEELLLLSQRAHPCHISIAHDQKIQVETPRPLLLSKQV